MPMWQLMFSETQWAGTSKKTSAPNPSGTRQTRITSSITPHRNLRCGLPGRYRSVRPAIPGQHRQPDSYSVSRCSLHQRRHRQGGSAWCAKRPEPTVSFFQVDNGPNLNNPNNTFINFGITQNVNGAFTTGGYNIRGAADPLFRTSDSLLHCRNLNNQSSLAEDMQKPRSEDLFLGPRFHCVCRVPWASRPRIGNELRTDARLERLNQRNLGFRRRQCHSRAGVPEEI